MKYGKLILRNLFRNKIRALLTVTLMAVIFFFVATLMSILANFDAAANSGEGQNRLGVQSAISLANLLPFSHEQKIQEVPGVVEVGKLQWMGAYYKDQKNFFANFAVDHDKLATVWDDYKLSPEALAAFTTERQAAVVGPGLMKRYGWKLGDRVVLTGTIYPFNPEVVIRGVYEHKFDDSSFFIRMDYLEKSTGETGQVGTFWAKVEDPTLMPKISDQIDEMFKNSDYPTETFTEKEFQQQFMSMIGNIKLLFTTVSICSIFMVVLLGAITMSMSARERVTEIAVLKAIGYPRQTILALMLTEFVLLALCGGVVGAFGAKLIYKGLDMTKVTQGFLVNFGVNTATLATCIAASLVVGLLAGGLPAIKSANLSVVDGLRKVV